MNPILSEELALFLGIKRDIRYNPETQELTILVPRLLAKNDLIYKDDYGHKQKLRLDEESLTLALAYTKAPAQDYYSLGGDGSVIGKLGGKVEEFHILPIRENTDRGQRGDMVVIKLGGSNEEAQGIAEEFVKAVNDKLPKNLKDYKFSQGSDVETVEPREFREFSQRLNAGERISLEIQNNVVSPAGRKVHDDIQKLLADGTIKSAIGDALHTLDDAVLSGNRSRLAYVLDTLGSIPGYLDKFSADEKDKPDRGHYKQANPSLVNTFYKDILSLAETMSGKDLEMRERDAEFPKGEEQGLKITFQGSTKEIDAPSVSGHKVASKKQK